MDPYTQFRYIVEAMHIEEPQYDQMAYEDAKLDFGHSPRIQIAGTWQPDEGFMAGP